MEVKHQKIIWEAKLEDTRKQAIEEERKKTEDITTNYNKLKKELDNKVKLQENLLE